MIDLNTFQTIMKESGDRLPLLSLDEFFDGNTVEDSIAPNQWGYGRPSLEEMWQVLRSLEAMPDVAWVRVILHDDTEIRECDGEEILDISGEGIALCTTAQPLEIEKLVKCEWLCSNGVVAIDDSELRAYSHIPQVPEGFRCLEIVWD